ncbi:MAG: phosphodiester glycosidase family protein [Bulleidia sp.]|nr:phosphodiester glycosidase family protein [Bulleidia sp.]
MKNWKEECTKPDVLAAICIGMVSVVLLFTYIGSLKARYGVKSSAYCRQQMQSLDEGSFEYMIAKNFYSKDELAGMHTDLANTEEGQTEETAADTTPDIEIEAIHGSTYQGYMMLVHNPEDVSVAINPNFATGGAGPSLDEYVSYYKAKAGLNAGGFEDVGGQGNGGFASGIVIHDGQLISGDPQGYWYMIGITYSNRLVCMKATGQQMLDWGVRDCVTFGPVFINEYQVVYNPEEGQYPMINPRSAIGQQEDGTFLLLAVDGRGPSSFGARYEDILQIMQDYGAIAAANLDGGNSTAMIYDGQYVNTPVAMEGSRNLPTAFLIQAEGN